VEGSRDHRPRREAVGAEPVEDRAVEAAASRRLGIQAERVEIAAEALARMIHESSAATAGDAAAAEGAGTPFRSGPTVRRPGRHAAGM
jgi:hypothetical protein